jgi:amino acid adenylation domain-containing protein
MSEQAARTGRVDNLVALVQRSVASFADRRAVSDDRRSLTYRAFDEESTALAALLASHGVTPGSRVAIYQNRSVEALVAILATLKAGATYVAVDVRYPDARRDLMLRHSGAEVVVTEAGLEAGLTHLGVKRIVFEPESLPSASTRPLTPTGEADASILFTSGSSGEPKGIVLTHRNILWFAENPGLPALTPEDRTGQISSLSFDAFHFEMWRTLAAGAEVVVLPAVAELLAADFRGQLKRRRITAMLVPTMVANQVVREDRDSFAPLRVLQVGGDVILPSICRDILAGEFGGELHNLYGPAEITTACTAHRVTRRDAESDVIPIGRPLAGVTVHVLTPQLAAVPAGEVGELYVASPGLARGYLDRPDLTSERFLPHPGGGAGPVYRTGDLVRPREDGVLEFVGRTDSQVKLRGYRVEPAEVEQALRRHPDVHEAVVLAQGGADQRHLVAVVVPESAAVRPSELRAFAEAELPDFMVPASFIVIDALPVNENGKRDLEEITELVRRHRERHARHVPPETETESYLASLWEDLLAVDKIGRTDDFFNLGGNSLLAFRMQHRVRKALDIRLGQQEVLKHPVLKQFAALVDEARTGSDIP